MWTKLLFENRCSCTFLTIPTFVHDCISVLSKTYRKLGEEMRLPSGPGILQTTEATSVMHCAILCTSQELCLGINTRLPSEEQTYTLCNLFSHIIGNEDPIIHEAGWSLYTVI